MRFTNSEIISKPLMLLKYQDRYYEHMKAPNHHRTCQWWLWAQPAHFYVFAPTNVSLALVTFTGRDKTPPIFFTKRIGEWWWRFLVLTYTNTEKSMKAISHSYWQLGKCKILALGSKICFSVTSWQPVNSAVWQKPQLSSCTVGSCPFACFP